MKTIKLFFACTLCVVILYGCSNSSNKSEKNSKNKVEEIEEATEAKVEVTRSVNRNVLEVIISENKDIQKAYYDLPHLKEFYDEWGMSNSSLPEINYPEDLTTLSYGDLRLLRNEILARNGYMFDNGFLRGYFNSFKWYKPIFDVDTIKIILNNEEQNLINAIIREESKRKENKTISQNDLQLYNADLIVNNKQFTEVHSKISENLKKQNFSIVTANRSMPFYVYDINAYQYIPHYITTDLYLFILHKYFASFLEKFDENFLRRDLFDFLGKTARGISEIKETNPDKQLLSSLEWAQMYCAIALYALGDSLAVAPDKYYAEFKEETQNIDKINGGPTFIKNRLVNYSELKPRGHYTKSEKLKKYFKGFKWISLNGINLYDDEQLKGMIVLAHIIKNDSDYKFDHYKRFTQIIEKLAGEEDNLSLSDVITALPDKSIEEVISDEYVKSVRDQLDLLNKERIKIVSVESSKITEDTIKRVYFLSSTYSISGEIFSKLVHIEGLNSKRPFPKGLDIPAVFGNETAEDILINEYKENSSWPDYLPGLNELQNQFSSFNNWDHNYGYKGVQTALASYAEQDNYPDFMKTDSYNRKELSTALASWTHIKHDLILYQEKPFAMETGQGDPYGPSPPQHYSYVEPNLLFWDSALELVEWLKGLSKYESTYEDELRRINKLGEILRRVAYKQINGEEVTGKEYYDLYFIGGIIESILFRLLETDHLPERERSMALIADVYMCDGENLNVAVGHADDIHVIVPIEGEYYIARGATFSYYEFRGKIYNDEEWRSIVGDKKEPGRPEWLKPILNRIPPLKGQMQFRYPEEYIEYAYGRF